MTNRIAMILSSRSAALARPRSQCHHKGSIAPIARAICALRQVSVLIACELLARSDNPRDGWIGLRLRAQPEGLRIVARGNNRVIRERKATAAASANNTIVATPVRYAPILTPSPLAAACSMTTAAPHATAHNTDDPRRTPPHSLPTPSHT